MTMRRVNRMLLAAGMVALLWTARTPAMANHVRRVSDLAYDAVGIAKELEEEEYHFRYMRDHYRDYVRDAADVRRLADRVWRSVRGGGCGHCGQRDVADLRRAIRHLDRLAADMWQHTPSGSQDEANVEYVQRLIRRLDRIVDDLYDELDRSGGHRHDHYQR